MHRQLWSISLHVLTLLSLVDGNVNLAQGECSILLWNLNYHVLAHQPHTLVAGHLAIHAEVRIRYVYYYFLMQQHG